MLLYQSSAYHEFYINTYIYIHIHITHMLVYQRFLYHTLPHAMLYTKPYYQGVMHQTSPHSITTIITTTIITTTLYYYTPLYAPYQAPNIKTQASMLCTYVTSSYTYVTSSYTSRRKFQCSAPCVMLNCQKRPVYVAKETSQTSKET